jgi:hypothetical protein
MESGYAAAQAKLKELREKRVRVYSSSKKLRVNGKEVKTKNTPVRDIMEGKNLLTYSNVSERIIQTNPQFEVVFKDLNLNDDLVSNKVSEGLLSESTKNPVETKSLFEKGRFVKYKGNIYIVTKLNDNGTIQIYNPELEGVSAKISVSPESITGTTSKANIITYKDAEYIVTDKDTIISLTTNKKMNWGEENGDRKNILQERDFIRESEKKEDKC